MFEDSIGDSCNCYWSDKLKIKKRRQTISSVKKKTWKLFSEYIRLRDCLKTTGLPDYGKCITCSRIVPRKLLQAGHLIPGRHNENLFSEKGCHAQCYYCNVILRGNTLEYRRKIIEIYGEGYDEVLERENRKFKNLTVKDLEAIQLSLKAKLEDLNERA